MIELLRAMVRARRAQALTMVLLVTVTIAIAVAVPAFLDIADDSMIQTEVAQAPAAQLDVFASQKLVIGASGAVDPGFGRKMPATMAAPDFAPTFSATTDSGVVAGAPAFPQMQFRQNACAHVVIVAGRCPIGTAEVMIDPTLARLEKVTAGGSLQLQFAINSPDHGQTNWILGPHAVPLTVSVVGVYQPRSATEAFWGQLSPFSPDAYRNADAPVLTTVGTIATFEHASEVETVDEVLQPTSLTVGRLRAARVLTDRHVAAATQAGAVSRSGLAALATRINQDRSTVRQVVPLLAVPLIALGWFVVFLAGGYSVAGRREEIGAVALRGSPRWPRWVLGTGESLVAVVAAVPCGYALGYAAVWAIDRFAVPHRPALGSFGHGSLPYVLLTVAGCVIAIMASAWRTLRSPASELLRNVPPRGRRWRSAAAELSVVALAAVAVITLRGEHRKLVGVDLIAPALAVAAVAVITARLVTPVAAALGAWSLRRGRGVGIAVSALQIARRPGVARLFVLLVTSVGVITYAAAAVDVSRASRTDRATMEVGATTVLSVRPTSRQALLTAVRSVDPAGNFAMAVVHVPQPATGGPSIVAVDASRLAKVASWPAASTITAAHAASVLRRPAGPPVTFAGQTVALTASVTAAAFDFSPPEVALLVEPLGGGVIQTLPMGSLRNGTYTYIADTTSCQTGCRVAGITIILSYFRPGPLAITFRSMAVRSPKPAPITTFADAAGWRDAAAFYTAGPSQGTEAVGGGLTLRPNTAARTVNVALQPADAPFPVPAISTQPFTEQLQGLLGSAPVPMTSSVIDPVLPQVAGNGVMVDLQNLDYAVPAVGDLATVPEVWLSKSAPPDVVSRLAKAGLAVTGSKTIAAERTYLDRRGPAVGDAFAWVAVVGITLLFVGGVMLTASVDRRRRGAELAALRVQGLSARRVRVAAVFGHVAVAVAALAVGLGAGLVGWWLTGARVPVFADGYTLAGAPVWPGTTGLAWPFGAVAVVLLAVSYAAAWDLRRGVPN